MTWPEIMARHRSEWRVQYDRRGQGTLCGREPPDFRAQCGSLVRNGCRARWRIGSPPAHLSARW